MASDIYGPAIFLSGDDGEEWEQVADGPAYPDGGDRRLRQVWTLRENRGKLYAGVQDAGIFTSGDGGRSWRAGAGTQRARDARGVDAGGGGALLPCLSCSIMPIRIACGAASRRWASFAPTDGGASWIPKNRGVYWAHEVEEFKEIGHCVHGLAQDPGRSRARIYRQDHSGMYRSGDGGGDCGKRTKTDSRTSFGFPIVLDRASRYLFAVPLEADQYRLPVEGALKVVRSKDGGESWHSASDGLPAEHAYGGVLRGAMAVDNLEPGGIYMGTTSGTLHVSRDLGTPGRICR